jgi:opacity protein-like surface antigen
MKARAVFIGLALLALAVPISAQQMGYYGLGPRVGVASNPDQVVGGMQFNFGEFAPRLRFQPNFEIGIGDDYTIFTVTAPVHYRFKVNANVVPYAGGGITLGLVDHDLENGNNDRNFEIAAKAVGGVEWPLKGSKQFFLELNLGIGDIQDAEVLAGWMFGASEPSKSGPSKATP